MKDTLLQFGLSEKEADVYMACLEIGSGTASLIAQKAAMKRVTAYVILKNLIALGVVQEEKGKKVATFYVLHPSNLEKVLDAKLAHIQAQKATFKNSSAQLEALYNFHTDKPVVQFFEGEQALEMLDRYGEDQMELGSVMMTIAPYDVMQAVVPHLKKNSDQRRIAKGLLSRSIYVADRELSAQQNNQELRDGLYLTRQELPIQGSFFVYPGWGIKFFHFDKKKQFGLLIQSAEVAAAMQEVFGLAWDGAKVRKIRRG